MITRRKFLRVGSGLIIPATLGAILPAHRRSVPRPPATSAVTPTSFPNLYVWYKADSLSLANNDPVAAWADSSGGGHDLSQSTAGDKPTYKTNQYNSLPCVTFDGTSDKMVMAASATLNGTNTADGYGIITVMKTTSTAVGALFYLLSNDAVNNWYERNASQYGLRSVDGLFGSGGGGYASLPNSALECAGGIYSGSGSNGSWYNGSTLISSTRPVTTSAMTVKNVGGDPGFTVNWKGDLVELIMYNAALSSVNYLSLFNDYLKPKWGLP